MGPTVLALTRQKLPVLDQKKYGSAEHVLKGAYILAGVERPDLLLLASGSEVHLVLQAYERLVAEGVQARVVSMPSWELFEMQSREYREYVLPSEAAARVAVEAGVELGWERYLGKRGAFVGMSSFGASAPAEQVFRGFGITVDHIVDSAKRVLS